MEREGGFSGRSFKKHPRVTAWDNGMKPEDIMVRR